MQSIIKKISKFKLTGLVAMFALVAIAAPQQASALTTSGDATIHNAVTVSYNSGTTLLKATANVNVKVATIGAAPTITAGIGQTAVAGDTVTYTYTVRSNTNGPDTYTPENVVHTEGGGLAAASTVDGALGGAFDLWAGHVLSAGAGTITVPAGAVTGLVDGVSTIELLVDDGTGPVQQKYTVTTATAGTLATTNNATHLTSGETSSVLTLTPIGGADAIVAGPGVAGSVLVGAQAGEYKTFDNALDVGTPTPGVDGTISTVLDITATAGSTPSPAVITTVSAPELTIVKASRNFTTGGAFVTDGTTTAKPLEVIEYQITVTNTHASASATVVSISDAIPVYTAIVTGAYNGAVSEVSITETIAGVAQPTTFATAAIDTDVAEIDGVTGKLKVNIGALAGDAADPLNGGTILGSALVENVVVIYQVTVQ